MQTQMKAAALEPPSGLAAVPAATCRSSTSTSSSSISPARWRSSYSPVMDVKEYPENVDVCLIEGAICNEDNLELLHKIRARTKVLVSFGDCAVTANVPAIRNQLGLGNAESVLQRAYIESAQANPGVPKEAGHRAAAAGARDARA